MSQISLGIDDRSYVVIWLRSRLFAANAKMTFLFYILTKNNNSEAIITYVHQRDLDNVKQVLQMQYDRIKQVCE